ncbi:sterol desaturase family protein [Tenacibaculum aiptasiae]|uniref:sterol desaturase family protein n=1 Tax=Tenacibaculum aiptasiae TaxID=426481 RepID=UPI003B5B61DE
MLDYIINIIQKGLNMPFSYFQNPSKRIYVLYLFTAMILALYTFKKIKPKVNFVQYLLPKKIWFSSSAFIDYYLIFINSFIKLLCIAPYLIYGLYIAFYTNEFLINQFGYPKMAINSIQILLLYTFTLTILNDFFSFLIHYAMHKIPFLWEFHKIHHSATSLTPITQYRLHPVELIINNIRGIIIFGLTTGLFEFLSGNSVHKVMFLGANIFSFFFFVFGANLRHSHVRFTYFNWLEYIFISPFQHQIHHSNNENHFNKNMGAKLAIWDWMFGTLVRSEEIKKVKFGLGLKDDENYNTLTKNLYKPFSNLLQKLKKTF